MIRVKDLCSFARPLMLVALFFAGIFHARSQTVASFTAPDTVCVGAPVNITNTSSNASSYYWNFCVANIANAPTGLNFGNISNAFSSPVYIDYVFENGSYYGFLTNNWPGRLLRLDFGNSLLNMPTIVDLGTVGGVIQNNTEGIQVIKNEGKWYVIIVGGEIAGGTQPYVIRVDLGVNITNTSPTAVNWGNIGNMSYPHDLYVFEDNGTWYGLTVNTTNNTITRFNFTNSFANTPSAVNLGNIGGFNGPTGLHAFKDGSNWYAFVTNAFNNTLTRLDFGSSLLGAPTGINLGNVGGALATPWDIYVMKYCGQNLAFVVNGDGAVNNMLRLDFGASFGNAPAVFNYGNVANFSFPHCLSKLFRVGNDLYSFVTNVNNNTLSRVRFSGCTSASIPGSASANPGSVTYSSPGTYNINLTVDDGLATQSSFCSQVVVVAKPVVNAMPDTSICPGGSFTMGATATGATAFIWTPATGLSNPNVLNPVVTPSATTQFIIKASNGGCTAADTVLVTVKTPLQCQPFIVSPSFSTPDTVCVNSPVAITNNSVNASSYFWNFCTPNVPGTPNGVNLGNPGNKLSLPVYMDYVLDNGNYYGFMVNNWPGRLLRLDFGNSLLNTPTVVDLGNPGGVIPNAAEGIQLVKNGGNWYVIIVGGDPTGSPPIPPAIVKIELGASLTNTAIVGTYWGNLGNLSFPHDLHLFQENGDWYGLTLNTYNNSITRFNFTSSFSNTPTAVNFGNVGGLDGPTGFHVIKEGGNWIVFVTNKANNTITRLNFGASLLNTPTGVNLGNVGSQLSSPWDILIFKNCGKNIGYILNAAGTSNSLLRLDFGSSLTNAPTIQNLGNVAGFNFPHCLSRPFRVGSDLFSFVANVSNNTLSRVRFPGCVNPSIPNSNAASPAAISYPATGTYNINLSVDDGLATQDAYCRQIVVMAPPAHSPTVVHSICSGASVKLGSPVSTATYLWNTGSVADTVTVNAAGIYWVESTRFGCMVRDSFIVAYLAPAAIDFGYAQNNCDPRLVSFNAQLPAGAQSFQWTFGDGNTNTVSGSPANDYAANGIYSVKLKVITAAGCADSIVKPLNIMSVPDPALIVNSDTSICLGDSLLLSPLAGVVNPCWTSSTGILPQNNQVKPVVTTTYNLLTKVPGNNLVTNGSFTAGSVGFQSDYNLASPNTTEGQYWVGSNASSWNPGMSNCTQPDGTTGNMLLVNGSPVANAVVWTQSIAVATNTSYDFSVWITALSGNNPANLQFYINGLNVGGAISPTNNTCQWQQFSTTWNSGGATTAVIKLVNNNTIASGNDFAVDDVYFGTTSFRYDSVTVAVGNPCDSVKITGPLVVCSAKDTFSYTVFKPAGCAVPYQLKYDTSFIKLIGVVAGVAQVQFKKAGVVKLTVILNGCQLVSDSLAVDVKLSPQAIPFPPDINSCRDTIFALNAGTGFASYVWQDGSTDSIFQVSGPGTYHVAAVDFCGRSIRDTFRLNKVSPVPFSYSPASAAGCLNDSLAFGASGGQIYSWQPAGNFAFPSSSVTKGAMKQAASYFLQIKDTLCRRDTLITIPLNLSPVPVLQLSKSNDVSCSVDTALLSASGALNFAWSPNLAISGTTGASVIVRPPVTTTYYVIGTNAQGCRSRDSITVLNLKTDNGFMHIPNAFTPNGDGKNDIFVPLLKSGTRFYDFKVFNRWGELLFHSTTPKKGWDGTFQGSQQAPGIFVYLVVAEGNCENRIQEKGTFMLIR